MNEYRLDLGLNDQPKSLVSMGAYVIILPDKKYINTADITDYGDIEASFTTSGQVSLNLCNSDGEEYQNKEYQNIEVSSTAPTDTGKLWIDTSTTPHGLKQYASGSAMWVVIPTTYVKISAEGIGEKFRQGDGVKISGVVGFEDLNGTMVVQKRGDDYIVVIGIMDYGAEQTEAVSVSRTMPNMDFIVESGNRLWGCRYGLSRDGQVVNELYASKLGDFKNWDCFQGVSTDSYVASLGTDGVFTGAIAHGGYPIFFKDGFLHKVYGTFPKNFQVQVTACRGVQQGCEKSLAIVNEILYYKSRMAVCAYDGSLPVEVSGALGETAYFNAVAGAHGNKYYISMMDSGGIYHLFVYDTAKRMWHREDNTRVDCFCSCKNEMYFIDHADGKIKTVFGSGAAGEEKITWMAQTGVLCTDMPEKKYISKLNIRMALELGTRVEIFIQYDSVGPWEYLTAVTGQYLRSFTLPVMPKRCDHLRLRIRGQGEAKIFSICKTISQGSDY